MEPKVTIKYYKSKVIGSTETSRFTIITTQLATNGNKLNNDSMADSEHTSLSEQYTNNQILGQKKHTGAGLASLGSHLQNESNQNI